MGKNKRIASIVAIVIAACLIMAWIDAVIKPGYALKSIVKLGLFTLLPLLYCIVFKESFTKILHLSSKSLKTAVLLGAGVYAFILGAYFVLSPLFDFTRVTTALQNNIGVNKDNFVFVALYISFINSLLEEFFFRGVAFLMLRRLTGNRFANIFSAMAFALYHIAIMTSWFSFGLFVLLIAGLFAAGVLFNILDGKYNNIYVSWLVHMFANFSINTIGFILFGLI